MAKKSTTANIPIPATLTVNKGSFKSQLSDRISLGQELYDRSITHLEQLEDSRRDCSIWDDYNSEFLKQSFAAEVNEYKTSYDDVNRYHNFFGGATSNQEKLNNHKDDIRRKIDNLYSLLNRVDLLKVSDNVTPPVQKSNQSSKIMSDNKQVFVVYGHNQLILTQVARDLERLELNPIILNEQPNAGRTVIEKFEQSSEVGFAVVLLTNDDEGKAKNDTEYRDRARQNVILELGYFIGKLGRARVCALYSDGVELPSDIHGLVYVPIDQNGHWKFKLVKELKAAGYDVDANKII